MEERKRKLDDLDGEATARRVAEGAIYGVGLVPGLIVEDGFTLRSYRLHEVEVPESPWSLRRNRVIVSEIDGDTGLDLRWEPNPYEGDTFWPRYSDELYNTERTFRWHQATLNTWLGLDGPPFLDAPTEGGGGIDCLGCDCCGIFFEENFVCFELGKRFLKVDARGALSELNTMCLRCAERHARGRDLWRFLRLRLLLKCVGLYWNTLVHRPPYLARLMAEAGLICGGLFQGASLEH